MALLDMLQLEDRKRRDWEMAQMQYPGAQSSPVPPVAPGAETVPPVAGVPETAPVPAQADSGGPPGLLDRLKQEWSTGELQNRMAGVFAGASMNPNKYVMQNSAQRAAEFAGEREKAAQMELINAQANKTADWLEAQGQVELAGVIRQNPELGSKMLLEYQKAQLKPQEKFSQVRGRDIGMTGASADAMFNVDDTTGKITAIGGAGTSVNVNNKLPPNISPPEKGYRYVYDENGNVSHAELIPGSKADQERQATEDKAANLKGQQETAAYTVVQDLTRMRNLLEDAPKGDSPLGKVGAATSRVVGSKIYGTDMNQMSKFKESALSNVGIDQLMQMKFNSPTGGALGQVPFQQQQRLEQLLGSLDVEQDPKVLEDNINRIQNIYLETIHGTKRERDQLLSEGKITKEQYDAVESQFNELSFDPLGNPKDKEPELNESEWKIIR